MKWTEAMIREELQRLDALTGLHGNDLPVSFSNSHRTLGCYITVDNQPHEFRFSRVYFESEDFSVHAAYDVIRHEYAHYMNHMLHGEEMDGRHGEQWKACCRRVGARPSRLYDAAVNDVHLRKERAEAEALQARQHYLTWMKVGGKLRHPRFGLGEICAIEPTDTDARLLMRFPSGEMKTLSAKWMAGLQQG